MTRRPLRRAFSLIELVSVIVIMGAVAAVASPLIAASAQTHATAARQREIADSLGAAMERIVRLLRETPAVSSRSTSPDITIANPGRVTLANGYTVELSGSDVWLTVPGQPQAPLCRDVDAFTLTYRAEDGVTDASATPTSIQRIEIAIESQGVELRTCVFLRCTRPPA